MEDNDQSNADGFFLLEKLENIELDTQADVNIIAQSDKCNSSFQTQMPHSRLRLFVLHRKVVSKPFSKMFLMT